MNILTKVFVVLMCVFSIALVALVVPFAANVENYKEQRDAFESSAAAARADAALAQQRISDGVKEKLKEISDLKAQLDAERATILSLKSTITGLEADVKRQEGTVRSHEASIASQTAAVAQLTGIQKDLRDELKTRRAETVDLTKKTIQLEAANNELSTIRDTLIRQGRLSKETIAALNKELEEANEYIQNNPVATTTTSAEPEKPQPVTAIRGQVTAVQKAGADITLAELNIGSNDGVQAKMEFIIHRDSEYLGTLVITTVDLQKSAGTLRTVRSGKTIKIGDQAIAGPIGR